MFSQWHMGAGFGSSWLWPTMWIGHLLWWGVLAFIVVGGTYLVYRGIRRDRQERTAQP